MGHLLRLLSGLVVALGLAACGADSKWAPQDQVDAARFVAGPPTYITLYTVVNTRTGSGAHSAILVNASRDGLVDAAHDLSEGGLAAGLAEMGLRFGVGARVAVDGICERDGVDPFTALFSESQARALVALPRSEELRFTDMTS
ncbi:MAG: AIR synthase-related protein, partial [Tabrizicola sp.]